MSTTGAELAVIFFTICNAIRLFAAFQQLMMVMRDRQGAAAISCSSWFLFSLANASTAVYAGLVLRDQIMTVLFVLNAIGTFAVLMATLVQRRTQRSEVW
jgi:predicted MFS family arabinose efflux permease